MRVSKKTTNTAESGGEDGDRSIEDLAAAVRLFFSPHVFSPQEGDLFEPFEKHVQSLRAKLFGDVNFQRRFYRGYQILRKELSNSAGNEDRSS